jgi:dehydrogenase/reductase SDR family member 7
MQFASLGAKLILSARNRDELERVKQNIISKSADYSCCLFNYTVLQI